MGRKILIYRKKGMTQVEALNRALQKLYHKKQPRSMEQISSTQAYDPELYAKFRKQTGMSAEEYMRTLQLKKEIDNLFD